MFHLRLTGLLCLLAGPLRAQPQLAERTDTTAATPVMVPIPAAVRQACQRYLPQLAASPTAVWTAYADLLLFEVTGEFTRTDPRWVDSLDQQTDTLKYTLTASFESTGRLQSFDKEAALDTLPGPVRRAIQRVRRRVYANGEIVLIVGSSMPAKRRPSRRASYQVWLYNPQVLYRPDWCDFWRNGQPVRHGPTFR